MPFCQHCKKDTTPKRGMSWAVVSRNILCRSMMSWVFLRNTAQEWDITWQAQRWGWVYSAAHMTPCAKSHTAVGRVPKQCRNLQDFHVLPCRHSTSSSCRHSSASLLTLFCQNSTLLPFRRITFQQKCRMWSMHVSESLYYYTAVF